jgi:uncharacterized protein (UPF0248 family)
VAVDIKVRLLGSVGTSNLAGQDVARFLVSHDGLKGSRANVKRREEAVDDIEEHVSVLQQGATIDIHRFVSLESVGRQERWIWSDEEAKDSRRLDPDEAGGQETLIFQTSLQVRQRVSRATKKVWGSTGAVSSRGNLTTSS